MPLYGDVNDREQAFHSAVREYVVCLLIFIALYALSSFIIRCVKKRSENDELFAGDKEDYFVYRVAVWICQFSVAVAIGAVILLPFSIISNEIVRLNPNSYYFQWLNSSLVHSLWNYIFLLSNLCLFILLPFSYFFIESQGFNGLRRGIMTRFYEAILVCVLVIVVLVCLAYLVTILLMDDTDDKLKSLFYLWNNHLPFVYSCVSLFGVVLLLICTPVGFGRMFTVTENFVVRVKSRKDIDADFYIANLERSRLEGKCRLNGVSNGHGKPNGVHSRSDSLKLKIAELASLEAELVRQKRSLRWYNRLKYPIAMLFLLAMTATTVGLTAINILALLVGKRSLPTPEAMSDFGNRSESWFGIYGSLVEVMIIFYVMASSLVGFYSIPVLRRLTPLPLGQCSMTVVIVNSAAVMVLSSALPVLSRTIGLTNFNLLGDFGRIDWLGSFYLVCGYNLIFAVLTGLCLATKFTPAVRHELRKRFSEAGQRLRRRHCSSVATEAESDHAKDA